MHVSRLLAGVLATLALLGPLSAIHADIPGLTVADTIDPSLGTDAFGLTLLRVNHATHKLYTAGYPSDSTRNFGLKVLDTTSNSLIAGIDLGRYSGSYNGVWPLGMAIDESAAPLGDKVYLICRTDGSGNVLLRVIDGPTNTNLTGENTDLFLPIGIASAYGPGFRSLAVNSSNHKLYVAKENGEIVVVDGPNRQILKTISPNFGDLVVANPAANKVFVVNHNGGGVINSADDSFAPLSLFFTATAAALDPTHGRIYFVGKTLGNSNAIFAVDATTGQIVGSRTGLANAPVSVTVKPDENTVYAGSATELLAFDGATLAPKGTIARPALRLACDSSVPAGLYFLDSNSQNSVTALTFATGAMTPLTMGYRPLNIAVNNRINRIYVTDEQTSELLVIDGSNHAITNRIVIPRPEPPSYTPLLDRLPRRLAVSERLNRIYLPRTSYDSSARADRSFLDVVDGETNQVRGSIALDPTIGFYADRVAVDDTRRRIYVVAARQGASFSRDVMLVVYDADTETRIATMDLGSNFLGEIVRGLAVNPVTGRVYASITPGVVIVDGNTNTRLGTVNSVGGEIAINRRTNKIYANGVAVIDGATDSLERTIPIENNNDFVTGFDVDEVTNRLYVAHGGQYALTGRLTAYDANNNYQLLGQTNLHHKPAGVAFSQTARELIVSHDLDGVISVFKDDTAAPSDIFANISTRARVGAGDDALIGGFIIYGPESVTKKLMIRAIGPSLTQAGISNALSDTTLEVHDGGGNVITNDNWKISDGTGASQQAEIEATGIPPANDRESALVLTLPAGRSVTAVVRGKNGAEGIGLVEVYDLDQTLPAKLVNISTRGHVGLGDNAMIAGVIILGSKPVNVVVRALGPSLANSSVPNPLEDPVLELRGPNGGLIASNDDWQEQEAEVNATLLAPTHARESAIVARLYPANYTAIARGKDGGIGVALVDAYYQIVGQ